MGRVMGAPPTEKEWLDKATAAAVAGARRITRGLKSRPPIDQLGWRLLGEAETMRDHGPGRILKRSSEFNEKAGDPIPF
jgi:hypothetical protein